MSSESLEGPAFALLPKCIATALMLALAWYGMRMVRQSDWADWPAGALGFLGAVLLVVSSGYYWILRSRTSVNGTHIRQTWLWPKQVAIGDVTQAKFIYLPYLAWLIAPRLVVRVQGRGMFVFHAATPALQQAFARLSLGLPPFP